MNSGLSFAVFPLFGSVILQILLHVPMFYI